MTNDDLSAEDLLAIVAHDLKSPISAVRGYIDLVQQAGELNERQARYCSRAILGLERMERMISSMLEMSRLEGNELTLELTDCDLGVLAQNALQMVESQAQRRGIEIQLEVEDHIAPVYADSHLLDQVINNLLTNAIKYNRENGAILIQVSNQSDKVRVDVKDTGFGIPKDDQPRVFERFFRARNRATNQTSGSGLGLTIIRTIIERHDGYVWFDSVEGEGSTFSFTLPRHGQFSEGADQIQESESGVGEGRDVRQQPNHELAIEEHDDVDDNTQEARPMSETDSSSDVV